MKHSNCDFRIHRFRYTRDFRTCQTKNESVRLRNALWRALFRFVTPSICGPTFVYHPVFSCMRPCVVVHFICTSGMRFWQDYFQESLGYVCLFERVRLLSIPTNRIFTSFLNMVSSAFLRSVFSPHASTPMIMGIWYTVLILNDRFEAQTCWHDCFPLAFERYALINTIAVSDSLSLRSPCGKIGSLSDLITIQVLGLPTPIEYGWCGCWNMYFLCNHKESIAGSSSH